MDKKPKVVYSTNCYEKDFEFADEDFEYRIALNKYDFTETWIIVLNTKDPQDIALRFEYRADKVIIANQVVDKALKFFDLDRNSFKDEYADGYKYSIASLIELYMARDFDYICHFTSDVSLHTSSDWITPGIKSIINGASAARPGYPRYETSKTEEEKKPKTNIFSDHAYLIPVKEFLDKSIYHLTSPKVEKIHPSYGGESFERKITRYLMANNKYEEIIPNSEIIHPCY